RGDLALDVDQLAGHVVHLRAELLHLGLELGPLGADLLEPVLARADLRAQRVLRGGVARCGGRHGRCEQDREHVPAVHQIARRWRWTARRLARRPTRPPPRMPPTIHRSGTHSRVKTESDSVRNVRNSAGSAMRPPSSPVIRPSMRNGPWTNDSVAP